MSSTKVLWYLWWRQFLNGLKRAVSTPRRLISILIGLGYYVGFFVRPWDRTTSASIAKEFPIGQRLEYQTTEHIVFLLFAFLSMLLAVGIFGLKNTFKQSDVDVLFPLPISSKTVMFFRLLRDYALTLFFPLILSFFAFQPIVGVFRGINKGDPDALSALIRGSLLAWLLLTLAWVCISYALSFFVAKNEKRSRLITTTVGWTIFLAVMSIIGYFGWRMSLEPSFATLSDATTQWWIRIILFMPTAASAIIMGAFQGSIGQVIIGISVFLIIIGLTLTYASNLSGWMYDQAATKGFQVQALRDFQRKGDYTAIAAERARLGQIKKGKLAKRVAHWNFRGGWTLIYKEILIQSRIGFWMNLFFLLLIAAFGIMFLVLPDSHTKQPLNGAIYLGMTGFMAVNMSSFQSYTGFTETLRRVEVMKPLPLTSAQIAFFETTSKAAVAMMMSFLPFVAGFIYKPSLWAFHVSGMIAAPMLSLALVAAIFMIVVLFPDFDDPTQRSFRGIMQLIALVVIMAPTGGIFVALMLMGISPVIPALISAVINLGVTALLTTIAGRFYADFNPSE